MRKPVYRLTRAADAALDDIYRYGVANFGSKQASGYLLELHDVFEMLARFPESGRPFHEFRRHEHGSHIVFYAIENGDLVIVDLVRGGRDLNRWLGAQKERPVKRER